MAWILTISVLLTFALRLQAQSIFINNVPEYGQLASCAEEPLSTIVRDMTSGCGDDKSTTSYHCFCTASSSKMSSYISREVIKSCFGNSSIASSALAIFSSYCQIDPMAAIPTISGNSTGSLTSPTPANTATSMVTSTTILTGASSTSSASTNGISTSSKIVIGVVVPVSLIIIAGGIAAAILVIRSHRRRAFADTIPEAGPETKALSEESLTDRGSARSLSTTKHNLAALELASPGAKNPKPIPPAELPTDGRFGNGTTAHELQE